MGERCNQHGSVRSCKSGFDSRPAHHIGATTGLSRQRAYGVTGSIELSETSWTCLSREGVETVMASTDMADGVFDSHRRAISMTAKIDSSKSPRSLRVHCHNELGLAFYRFQTITASAIEARIAWTIVTLDRVLAPKRPATTLPTSKAA